MAKTPKLTTEQRNMQESEALKIGATLAFLGGGIPKGTPKGVVQGFVKNIEHQVDTKMLNKRAGRG